MRSLVHSLHTHMQSTGGQAPASASTANAELARLDAQIEIAAKKAALAGMQRAAAAQNGADGGPASAPVIAGDVAQFPAVGAPAGGRITFEKDGKTITLDNPTADQLRQVGVASSAPDVNGWQLVAMTGATMWGIVAIVWIVLSHRRRNASVAANASSSPDMSARMARIENAIESVAVEVERISEGQRFTSRMLSEGAARPVDVAQDNLAAVLNNRGEV
jgi:hypothetical protein